MEDSNPFVGWKQYYLAQGFRSEGRNEVCCSKSCPREGREDIGGGIEFSTLSITGAVGELPLGLHLKLSSSSTPLSQAATAPGCLLVAGFSPTFSQSRSAALSNSVCLNLTYYNLAMFCGHHGSIFLAVQGKKCCFPFCYALVSWWKSSHWLYLPQVALHVYHALPHNDSCVI